jgi:hypothetical protein
MIVNLSMLLTVVVGFVTVNLGSVYFLGQRLGSQIDRLDIRIDRLEGRIDRLGERIDVLHDSVAGMGARITRLEDRFGGSAA